MKSIMFLLIIPFFVSTNPYSEIEKDQPWLTNYEKALKVAKKENKNVLVYFSGSDWCAPCEKLKTDLFESSEFKALANDYVLLYVDLPRNKDLITSDQLQHNKDLLKKYNKKGVFPLLKIVNEKGKALDEYSGYSMNGEIRYHLELLNKYN